MTRYFTCEDASAAYALTFDVREGADINKAIEYFRDQSPDFPDIGDTPWREMTDEEAIKYQEEQADEEKRERSVSLGSYDDEDDE